MTIKRNDIPSLHSLLESIVTDGDCADLVNEDWKKELLTALILRNPFDAHLHLRDGKIMELIAPSSETFAGGVIMPNLQPPIEDVRALLDYKERIEEALDGHHFIPNMTVNFKNYTPQELQSLNEHLIGIKMYPKGWTTNSESGVNGAEIDKFRPTLEAMSEMKIPLLVHGEIVDGGDKVDILDKERRFADTYVALAEQFPDLKIIMEHISTKELVDLVKNPSYKNLFATATLHHLLIIHNHILEGGTKPHNMCMPIPKLYDDRKALLREVLNGNPKIMFGSDSAPHPKENKESANGCCGCFTSPIALQALTEIFEYFGEVPKLQDFISGNAQRIYGDRLSLVNKNVVLRKADVIVPLYYSKSGYRVVPFMDGKRLSWDIYSII